MPAEASDNIGEVVKMISEITEKAGEASSQVTAAAGELTQQSEMLKSAVDEFMSSIRAA